MTLHKGIVAREEAARVQLEKSYEAENRRLERTKLETVIRATDKARAREAVAKADADGARSELDRLRSDSLDFRVRASTADIDACRKQVDTASKLFDQCAERYQRVAEAADAHASDTLTLQQAWPK